jgi:uroporphyrinogen decarboxylase
MRDRFLRACRRESVDTTAICFMRQAGRALPEYRAIRERTTLPEITSDPALCAKVTLQPVRRLGVDATILFADVTTPLAGIGVAVEIVDGVGPIIERPIRTAVDIEGLRSFEPETAVSPLLKAIRMVRRESATPLIGFAGGPFTLAPYLLGGRASRHAQGLKTLLHTDPATFHRLVTALVDMSVAYQRAQVAVGAQGAQLFDSWVGTLSPFDYGRSVAPHMRRLFTGLADLDVPTIHFGIDSAGLLRLMADAGGDVIGLDWRIGLADGWAVVPDRAIHGNLDPALLLGPFDAVADQALWILDQAAGRPGHVFNLGHGVLPGTDPDHLRRLVDVVHEAGARSTAFIDPSLVTSATTRNAR